MKPQLFLIAKHVRKALTTKSVTSGRVNYLEVTRHQHDQRLDNFLLNRLKGLPKSQYHLKNDSL